MSGFGGPDGDLLDMGDVVVVLCWAGLCCLGAVLRCGRLCHVVLVCAVLCRVMLGCVTLYRVVH